MTDWKIKAYSKDHRQNTKRVNTLRSYFYKACMAPDLAGCQTRLDMKLAASCQRWAQGLSFNVCAKQKF